jgi:acetylornithine deacetylase
LIARGAAAARRAAAPLVPAIDILSDSPPMVLAEDAPIHRFLCDLLGQQAGATVSFATDAGWLQRLGLDCALFGPGSIADAHRPDEHVPKGDLLTARTVLERTVGAFCRDSA